MFLVRVLCFCLCFYLVISASGTYRLSANEAVPKHYSLTIRPDFDNGIFHGEVTIYIVTQNSLANITLHSVGLNISEVKINQKSAYYELKSDEKISVFYGKEFIQPGEQLVNFKYSGVINTTNGFIKATYEMDAETVYVYVTDLEPRYARMVFPCFDEPSFKANFNVRLIAPNSTYTAISNMPSVNNFNISDGVVYDFATSVKMSPYLLTFAFTDTNYSYYEDTLEYQARKIPIRVHTVNASQENNEFTVNCTKTALEFYSNYTGISYPLSKLDMMEYRRNLSAATENWGLITFREGLLTPSLRIYNKYQIKLVMFHELSHFWFGNLVTNKWWDDIWLHEGFATYMSYKLLAIDGKKSVVEEMKGFNFQEYLDLELYDTIAPIVSYLSESKEIDAVFNDIVYNKGAGILLNLETIIGEEKFQTIVRTFLKNHAFSSATTNDFITVVESVVPSMSLRSFLEGYLYQSKYPTIYIDVQDNSTYLISQKPCESVNSSDDTGERWTIPISYQTDSTNTSRFWFDRDMDCVRIELPDTKWIIFNPRGIGIYRTVWSSKMWARIINNFELMPAASTETILSDFFYSFRMNKVGCDVYIQLMGRLTAIDKKKWVYFYSMLDHLKENLFCHNYKEEQDLLLKYFVKRRNETDVRRPVFINSDCNSRYIQNGKEYLKNLDQCAQWVRENLKDKDSNTINPIL